MYKCPKCGNDLFSVTAHIAQEWEIDGDKNFVRVIEDCTDVAHEPDEEDLWTCTKCGFNGSGSDFRQKDE